MNRFPSPLPRHSIWPLIALLAAISCLERPLSRGFGLSRSSEHFTLCPEKSGTAPFTGCQKHRPPRPASDVFLPICRQCSDVFLLLLVGLPSQNLQVPRRTSACQSL